MTDRDGMEFRAAAEKLWCAEIRPAPGRKLSPTNLQTIDLLAKALQIGVEEMLNELGECNRNPTIPMDNKAVAARIESRIQK
jgi:hypothetical protein